MDTIVEIVQEFFAAIQRIIEIFRNFLSNISPTE